MEMVKSANRITVSCGDLWLGEDGIRRLIYHPDSKITLAEAKEVGEASVAVSRGNPRPSFSDARGLREVSREARDYFASEEMTRWTIAAGTLNTPITKVLGGFYIKFNKPPYPLRFFTSESEAIAWLKGYVL